MLKAVAAETGYTQSQVIVAWVRQQTPEILPIIAGSKPAQVAQSVAALKLKLTPEQLQRLNTAGDPADAGGWITPT